VNGGLRAVVFDFYGTLTVSASVSARRDGASRVAAALGVPAERFFEHLSSTFTERATGRCGDLVETMAWLAHRCGGAPTDEQLAAACAERRATEKAYAEMLRSDSTETLLRLKEHGLRIGVVSDCTHELPECWAGLPIAELVDAVVFSIEAGQRKPVALPGHLPPAWRCPRRGSLRWGRREQRTERSRGTGLHSRADPRR
jgi:putative hydrolase of the HAD superfamily